MKVVAKFNLWFEAQEKLFDHTYEGSKQFAALLDLPYPRPAYWYELDYTPELTALLQHLANLEPRLIRLVKGPHGKTIIKIIKAKLDDR